MREWGCEGEGVECEGEGVKCEGEGWSVKVRGGV